MANRIWNRIQALDKEIKSIHATVEIGASGAVTSVQGPGFASVTRTAAGKYDVVLDDKYTRLVSYSIGVITGTAAIPAPVVFANDAAAGTLSFKTDQVSDLDDGSTLLIKLEYKNSSVGETGPAKVTVEDV